MHDVITRLRRIDDELPRSDGAAAFNRMYLTVTEAVAAGLDGDTVFVDPAFMEQLDVDSDQFLVVPFDLAQFVGDVFPVVSGNLYVAALDDNVHS